MAMKKDIFKDVFQGIGADATFSERFGETFTTPEPIDSVGILINELNHTGADVHEGAYVRMKFQEGIKNPDNKAMFEKLSKKIDAYQRAAVPHFYNGEYKNYQANAMYPEPKRNPETEKQIVADAKQFMKAIDL